MPTAAPELASASAPHLLSGRLSLTPGRVGQTRALARAALTGYASTENIAAFSVTQDAVLTIWNVVLGVVVMVWGLGFAQMKEMLSKKGGRQAQEQAGTHGSTAT